MGLDRYHAFTEELRTRLAADERVVGLVAVGSMAGAPDAWSDHDFFVITKRGAQESMRTDLAWLPEHERIVLSFRETQHGVKVVYDDGHLLELAVFDEAELAVARVNRHRVLLGSPQLSTANARPSDDFLFGTLVTNALVAAGRARRGETLSAASFVTSALEHLAALLWEPDDDLDPLRRFERARPELGAELAAIVRLAPDEAALGLLGVAERELRSGRPELAWAGLDAVRARLLQDSGHI